MAGKPISELNAGLISFKDELIADELAAKRVEVAVISFGPVSVNSEFTTADEFQAPSLTANGDTPMGAAIERGISTLEDRKSIYRQSGISYYRPWIFLITDGAPTDNYKSAQERVRAGEESKSFMFFAVGVDNANMKILSEISVREPLQLQELRFRDLFSWLSSSLGSVSRSTLGDSIPLANPASPNGWAVAG